MTRLLLACGSLREGSLNSRLLSHLAARADGRCTIDRLVPSEVELPLFNQDLEADPTIRARVARLCERVEASDGLLVASPEHNGNVSAFLKNLVDWLSRLPHVDTRFANPFRGRPLLLCSASTGWSGGGVAIPNARALFGYVGCMVLGDTICIPYADQAWSGNGFAFDPFFAAHIAESMEHLLHQGALFHQSRGRLAVADAAS
jgi:chromate reductase, NAD(P)H dehydrogenase (quinone)